MSYAVVIMMAIGMMSLASCTPDEEPEDKPVNPTLTLVSEEVNVPAEGGDFKIDYKLEDPADQGTIRAEAGADADWITDLNYGNVGTVTFSVLPNEDAESRNTVVTITYSWPEGEPQSVEAKIVQAGIDTPDEPEEPTETIALETVDVEKRWFSVNIVPTDKNMDYLVFFKTAEVFDSFPDMDSLVSSDMQYYAWMAYMYDMTESEAMAQDAIQGDTLYLCNADPETEYVLYAYGMDIAAETRITEVAVIRVTTADLNNTAFDMTVDVSGNEATVEVSPVDYDGYYWIGAWPVSDIDAGQDFADWCSDTWNSLRMEYEIYYGLSLDEILGQHCFTGDASKLFELPANVDCRAAVFALDDKAWLESEPVVEDFTTESTAASDNIITITVRNVTSREAEISFVPSNNDSFCYVVVESAGLEGMTDDEIIEYCTGSMYVPIRTGRYTDIWQLTPGTEYYALAFGSFNGDITTPLFKETFASGSTWVGTQEFSLEYGPWYDLLQLAEADPDGGWNYSAPYYDCLLPVSVPAELAEKEFYYALYTTDAVIGWDDERFRSELYNNGADYSPNYFLTDYGMEFILVGFAVDDNGDWGPVWKSEPFIMSLEGASDPNEYVN